MPAVMPLRLVYFCKPDELVCSRCGNQMSPRLTSGDDYVLATCANGRGSTCGERFVLLPGRIRWTVVRLTRSEFVAINTSSDANDILRDIGILAETVRKLDGAA